MSKEERNRAQRKQLNAVENPPGIHRTTMAFNKETMLCHFTMTKGAEIPLHHHPAVQNGYIIKGKVEFRTADGGSFIAETGSGYAFASEEEHGAKVLEDSEVIECFAPMRPEYADN